MSAKAERDEYLRLTEEQRNDEARLREQTERRDHAQDKLHALKDLVEELKEAQNQEGVLKTKLDGLERQKRDILSKESLFRGQLDEFVKGIEPAVGLAQLAAAIRDEVTAIRSAFTKDREESTSAWNPEITREVLDQLWKAIEARGIDLSGVSRHEILTELAAPPLAQETSHPWDWMEPADLRALEQLVTTTYSNAFPALDLLRQELSLSIAALPQIDAQCQDMKMRLAGKDYSSLKQADGLEQERLAAEREIEELRKRIADRARRIHQYDVTPLDEPDPRYDAAVRLKAFFEEAAVELLKAKKSRIEATLRDDLNRNLAAYRNVIDRVELSESLRNLSFQIFHKAGNEIYLGQLNAASKQVVIQVLLKALHEAGDYDPPVMIDTVMGVLDMESRATILTNYFPSLSHQTILLATDSEIEVSRDLPLLTPYIGKAWTLVRDRETQRTDVQAGYFGIEVGA
jgi:DNA sulfur modification protein DndD